MSFTLEQQKLWIDAGYAPVFDKSGTVTGFSIELDPITGLQFSMSLSQHGIGHKLIWKWKATD